MRRTLHRQLPAELGAAPQVQDCDPRTLRSASADARGRHKRLPVQHVLQLNEWTDDVTLLLMQGRRVGLLT